MRLPLRDPAGTADRGRAPGLMRETLRGQQAIPQLAMARRGPGAPQPSGAAPRARRAARAGHASPASRRAAGRDSCRQRALESTNGSGHERLVRPRRRTLADSLRALALRQSGRLARAPQDARMRRPAIAPAPGTGAPGRPRGRGRDGAFERCVATGQTPASLLLPHFLSRSVPAECFALVVADARGCLTGWGVCGW